MLIDVGKTQRIRLDYGRGGMEIDVPATADVIEPRHTPGLADELDAIGRALRRPIGTAPLVDCVPAGASVGVVICDVTRPFPGSRVLPVLLGEIERAAPSHITLYIATGTHRACTEAELREMVGPHILGRYRVLQHDASDADRHVKLGFVLGTSVPALIEREFLAEDVRITTGFIEPHFFAGFSGGPKMVAPGLAALETTLELHSAARVGHPQAIWGITQGNPIHDAVRDIAKRASVTFNLDVTLNRQHEITNVFAGELFASHAAGCAFARETAMAPVTAPYDVVVTTNSGYPLDQNLYQTVKGLRAADQIVRDGGAIIVASECSDGLPAHGRYRDLLALSPGPDAYLHKLEEPGFAAQDQWQVQVQALIQRRARVYVKADGLTPDQLRAAWVQPISDVGDCIEGLLARLGPAARLAVLPRGPQTIPYVNAAP